MREDKNLDECYRDLGFAIVEQAVIDTIAEGKIKGLRTEEGFKKAYRDAYTFLKDCDDVEFFTGLEGKEILKKIGKENVPMSTLLTKKEIESLAQELSRWISKNGKDGFICFNNKMVLWTHKAGSFKKTFIPSWKISFDIVIVFHVDGLSEKETSKVNELNSIVNKYGCRLERLERDPDFDTNIWTVI